jgi:hypothetical protein
MVKRLREEVLHAPFTFNWNADQTVLYATLLAWPDYMREAPAENRFVFEEREKGAPALLKAWFYRGNSHVQTFSYPKARIK